MTSLLPLSGSGNEMAMAAVQAQAVASVLARYQIAMARPRNPEMVRLRLLDICKAPEFAEAAIWTRPVGGGAVAEGLSIRAAEAIMRESGNMQTETMTLYDDAQKRGVRVATIDFETNATWTTELTLAKTVERKKLKNGQKPLDTRLNSYGETVYIVTASEDELKTRQASEVSKAARTQILRLTPADLQSEMKAEIRRTLNTRDAQDPAAARKKLSGAFHAVGVTPADLVAYLGHGLDAMQPAELQRLREMHAAIKAGEARWADYVETEAAEEEAPPKKAPSKTARTLAKLRAKKEPAPAQEYEPGQDEEGEADAGPAHDTTAPRQMRQPGEDG